MKRILAVGLLILAVALIVSVPIFASGHGNGDTPDESCPPGFDHAHEVLPNGQHDDGAHGVHKHVGNSDDKNDDGWICVKHTGKGDKIHVHADNNYRRGQQQP